MADISNYYSDTIITGTAEDDSIYNGGSNVTIEALAGNDSISNDYEASNVSISAGDGNDTIKNDKSDVTINAGQGDDSISIGSDVNNLLVYNLGDGKDYIHGFNATSTLQIGDGQDTYSKETSGSDIIITVGEEKITLASAAYLSTVNIQGTEVYNLDIVGTEDYDYIDNTLSGATIRALAGDDWITNSGSNVSIDAGAGDNHIDNSGTKVTVSSGKG